MIELVDEGSREDEDIDKIATHAFHKFQSNDFYKPEGIYDEKKSIE